MTATADQMDSSTSADDGKKRSWCKIDRRLLSCKLAFFIFHCGCGAYLPYINVFLYNIGLSASQVGICSGIRSVGAILLQPIWSWLADRTKRHQAVLTCIVIISILFVCPLPFVAKLIQDRYAPSTQGEGLLFADDMMLGEGASNASQLVGNLTSGKSFQTLPLEGTQYNTIIFYLMVVTNFIGFGCVTTGISFITTQCLHLVSKREDASFGQQRLFGSIGFGLSAAAAGALADNLQHVGYSKYTATFYWFILFQLVFFIILPFLYRENGDKDSSSMGKEFNNCKGDDVEGELLGKKQSPATYVKANDDTKVNTDEAALATDETKQLGVWYQVGLELRSLSILFNYTTCLVMGVGNALTFGFLFMLLEDEYNATKFQMGFAQVFSCGSELIALTFSKAIFDFTGYQVAILIGIISMVPRFLLCALLDSVWGILSTQLLHLFGFGMYWPASLEHLHASVSPQIVTTMIGIQYSLYLGGGNFLGNVIGGWLYQKYGGKVLFKYASFIFIVWTVLQFAFILITKRKGDEQKTLLQREGAEQAEHIDT